MRLSLSFVGISAALALAACGISVVGVALEGEDGRDAEADGRDGKSDGGPDRDGSASPDGCPAPSCSLPVAPPGWSLVVFGAASDTCPAGFDGQDAIEGPNAKDGACSCGACSITTKSDCNAGTVGVHFDNDLMANCTTAGDPLNAATCGAVTARVTHVQFTMPPRVPGVCTAPVMADKSKVTSQTKRVCAQQAGACLDSACKLAGTAKACIVQPGAVDCPSGMPDKHIVGDDFTLNCPACGCTVSGKCTGVMELYKEASCSGDAVTTIASGTCTNVPPFVGAVNSYKWKGSAVDEECKAAPPAGAVALTGTRTICCP